MNYFLRFGPLPASQRVSAFRYCLLSFLPVSVQEALRYYNLSAVFPRLADANPHFYLIAHTEAHTCMPAHQCILTFHQFKIIKLGKVGDGYHALTFMLHGLCPEAKGSHTAYHGIKIFTHIAPACILPACIYWQHVQLP